MMKIAVTCIQLIRDLDAYRPALAAAGFEVAVADVPGQHLEGAALVEALEGCAGVVAGDDRFTAAVLDRCPGLRVISKWGIGVDGIDLVAASARGIVVTNTPGMFDDEVADVAMAYITMLARDLGGIDRGVRAHQWPKPAGRSLRGAVLGIVGLGGIGRAVARRATAAGMTVVGSDPSEASRAAAAEVGVTVVSFHELLEVSEFVSVNCPLAESTFHLFDDAAFRRMRAGSWIVNTARGGVIDTTALVDALRRRHLAGAALDVLEEEPPSASHPIRQFDNVVFGSHNGSNTLEGSARVHVKAIDNLARALGVAITLP
jgi:phosphoglycerate dehydrogenase-like enzyme